MALPQVKRTEDGAWILTQDGAQVGGPFSTRAKAREARTAPAPRIPSPRDVMALVKERTAVLRAQAEARAEARREAEATLYVPTAHVRRVAAEKGFALADVLAAANRPTITYPSGRVAGQYRHVSGEIVAVVDPEARKVITAYRNVVETDVRPDQTDEDARRYAASRVIA